MFSSTLSVIALVAATLLPSASASSSNFTLRTTSSSSVRATCAKVSGTAYGAKFNFGCLCMDDLDDFCDNNNLNGYFKNIISNYISNNGNTFYYPSNAQPVCDGHGGYDCGSLSKLSNGQCGNQDNQPCPSDQCFSNGSCCPRGQTYQNGKCCASNGCDRNGQVCTPILTCSTYTSANSNICCPAGTSGWIGQKTRCCPPGQIESKDGSDCICPAGQKEDPRDANKCIAGCPTDCKWGATKCCPNDATEKNGACICPTGKSLNADSTKCIDQCDTANGWKWCNKKCCPKGSDENDKGVCVCSNPQTILNGAGTACVDRCPNGSFGSSICCNGNSKEVGGKCVCTSSSESYSGTGDAGKCVSTCTGGGVWAPKQRTCCPSGSTENDSGVCMCTDDRKKIVDGQCVDKCTGGQVYNPTTKTCCAAGSSVVNGQCGCPSTSQKLEGGVCVDKCKNGWVFGPNIPGDGNCCPPGSKPGSGPSSNTCVCNDPTQKITGTGPSQTCSNKCPTAGWVFAPKQNSCCPPNSQEVDGVCACNDNTKVIEGKDGSRQCVDRCKTAGWSWGGIGKQCCPPGSTEDCYGVCKCDSPSKQITGTGPSATCTDRCADKPADWKYWTSLCCPPGSRQKGDKCDCDDDNQKLVDGKCVDICPDGQYFAGSRCCPTDSYQWGSTCLCKKLWLGYTLSADESKCAPSCNWGYTFRDTKCCKDHLVEKNGQCVCPNAGESDSGNSCAPSCKNGEKYNSSTKQCETICADGFYYKKGWLGTGFCCRDKETACNTKCCTAPYVEIGSTGVCCTEGSTVVKGNCVSPTGIVSNPKRRSIPEHGAQIQLTKGPAVKAYYGLESNSEGKLCPAGLAACPIEGRGEFQYECLDSQSDLQSCGGCASMGTGEDCTAIPGARWMGCRVGKCEVYSCKAGWKLNKGRCEKK